MICQKRLVRVKENAVFILNQICFIFTLQEFNNYYYKLSEMESFSLTYSRMVLSFSAYLESSVSNQLSIMETSNINKNKSSAQIRRPIEQSFRKELQQKNQADNRPLCQIFDGIDKENDAVFKESSTEYNIKQIFNYRLNNDSNSLDPYTEILRSVIEQKENIDDVTDESQPFIREIRSRSAKKPSVILFLNQKTKDMERFFVQG